MNEIVFLLEEISAQAMLEGVLPRLLPKDYIPKFVVFEGKQDLDKQLVRRISGYRVPNARFVILRDKDSADCHQLKQQLQQKCKEAGKPNAVIRIACHELESWYLADLQAVETGLELPNIAKKQKQAKFRNPDLLANAAEELTKITAGVYQKVGGSRDIGPHLDLQNQRSRSFAVFVSGILRLLSEPPESTDDQE